jgi:hypothetical protein
VRFLLLNTDYPEFLRWLYAQHGGLEGQPYEEQMRVRMESLFGVADFYSRNLRKLGHEAWDVIVNNEAMQKAWAREHGVRVEEPTPGRAGAAGIWQRARHVAAKTPARHLGPLLRPVLTRRERHEGWFCEVTAAQVRSYKPDVLLNHAVAEVSTGFLRELKPCVRLLLGQHAATQLPDSGDWGCYDLVVSSFPPTVDWFRRKGVAAELFRLAFEPGVLSVLKAGAKSFGVSFIGSFHEVHSSRTALLEYLCDRVDGIGVWAPDLGMLSPSSAVRRRYLGQAWGREMYQILRDSRIALNHHGDVAPYANNLRLYEATGVGTLLVTDWKENLQEILEPGTDVVAYRNREECAELLQYYLAHDAAREGIARTGQARTLREHTYYQRMQELVDIVHRYL